MPAQLDAADEELRHIRSPHLLVRAVMHRRHLACRSCAPIEPSQELFEALLRLAPSMTAIMLATEAAIAWRAGALGRLPAYNDRIQLACSIRRAAAWYMDALLAVVHREPDESLIERAFQPDAQLHMRAPLCAAHAMAGGELSDEVRRSVHSWLDGWDYPGDIRRELLSPNEIRRALEGT